MGARIPKVRIEAHNSKLMREALEEICRMTQWGGSDFGNPVIRGLLRTLDAVRRTARRGLCAPPRNCDLIDNESKAFNKFVEAVGELAGPEAEVAKKVLRALFAKVKDGKEPVEI